MNSRGVNTNSTTVHERGQETFKNKGKHKEETYREVPQTDGGGFKIIVIFPRPLFIDISSGGDC